MCWWKQTSMGGCNHTFFVGDAPVRFCGDATVGGRPCGVKVGHTLHTVRVDGAVCRRCGGGGDARRQKRRIDNNDRIDRTLTKLKDGLKTIREQLEAGQKAGSGRKGGALSASDAAGGSDTGDSDSSSFEYAASLEPVIECDDEEEWEETYEGLAPLEYLKARGLAF